MVPQSPQKNILKMPYNNKKEVVIMSKQRIESEDLLNISLKTETVSQW